MKCSHCNGTGRLEVWELFTTIDGREHCLGILTEELYGKRPKLYTEIRDLLAKHEPSASAVKTGYIACVACSGPGRAA